MTNCKMVCKSDVDVLVGDDDEHINNAAVQKFSQAYEDAQETCILCHLLLESFESFKLFCVGME